MTLKYLVNSLPSQRDIVILVSSVLRGTGKVNNSLYKKRNTNKYFDENMFFLLPAGLVFSRERIT